MTYEQLLQRQPASTTAGNRDLAAKFVTEISTFLASGEGKALPPSQVNYLYKLRNKWQLRAQGKDEQWNQYGTKPGRRPKTIGESRADIDRSAYGTEDELDPLLRSLMQKFTTPQE